VPSRLPSTHAHTNGIHGIGGGPCCPDRISDSDGATYHSALPRLRPMYHTWQGACDTFRPTRRISIHACQGASTVTYSYHYLVGVGDTITRIPAPVPPPPAWEVRLRRRWAGWETLRRADTLLCSHPSSADPGGWHRVRGRGCARPKYPHMHWLMHPSTWEILSYQGFPPSGSAP
jgi:hypothetical protein